MRKQNSVFSVLIYALAALTVLALAFVVYFIVKEALPLFAEVSLAEFLLGTKWMPIDYTGSTAFGIFHFITATIYVSFLAMIAFLILVSISAIGSVIFVSSVYQLDFLTPGISPLYARFLKQIRQTPTFLKTA